MYVRSNGRGMGDAQVVTDPVTGEQKVVITGGPLTTATVTPTGTTYQNYAGQVIGVSTASGGSLTDFLNQNGTAVAIGAAILLFWGMAIRR